MASELVSAYQLYFMDNVQDFSTVEEACIKLEEEWKIMHKSIINFYTNKEMRVNHLYLYKLYESNYLNPNYLNPNYLN